jgi:hypothetical protein
MPSRKKYRVDHSFDCCDCGYDLDHYMVTDEVWAAAGLHWGTHCCLACLERRTVAESPAAPTLPARAGAADAVRFLER